MFRSLQRQFLRRSLYLNESFPTNLIKAKMATKDSSPTKHFGFQKQNTKEVQQKTLFGKKRTPLNKLESDGSKNTQTFRKQRVSSDNNMNNLKTESEDVHSRRFQQLNKFEGGDSMMNLRNELYKFTFDYAAKSINIDLNEINIVNIENEETFYKIPKLAHNLDVILKKPGVYSLDSVAPLQADGGEFLKRCCQPDEVDMSRIPPYTPPSEDQLLLKFARESKIKYIMSTSTISSVLSQIYYLFSQFRNPNFNNISEAYFNEPKRFMISQRKPITNFLRKVDAENGIYALDSDSGLFHIKNGILMNMGKILERSLTLEADEFRNTLLRTTPKENAIELLDDHHRFMKLNNEICLRSQIDCHAFNHETGEPFVFEIKTRSLCPIRYDLYNYEEYLDYKIKSYRGLHSSFEREYYDLIRGGFLKYCFQLKIGRMDGAFIAYHNTKEIFGFEYVKTKEIERRIFGNELYSDASFVCCSKLLTVLIDNIIDALKDEKYEMLKIGFYADSSFKKMIVFTELFDDNVSWSTQKLIIPTEEIKDEHDYFTKHTKFTNTVYKFEFHIFVYINGILQKGPGHELARGDQIEVKYKFSRLGKPTFTDYMNFLHEAYKMEALNLDLTYGGAWMKN